MNKLILVLLLMLIGGGIFYGYKMNGSSGKAEMGVLIVGTDATYPPLESIDDQGKFVGFDIDLVNNIASQMNMTAEIKNIPFDDIFNQLEKGTIEMIVSSVTINPERLAKYAFSNPYLNAGQVVVVRSDSAITGSQGLVGKKVGAQVETTSLTEAAKLTDPKLVKSYAKYGDAVKELTAKKIDAIIIDLPAGVGLTTENSNLKVVGEPFTQEFYGMVVLKKNEAMLTKVNEALAGLKRSGEVTTIRNKWKL